jgi:hypothetical protein
MFNDRSVFLSLVLLPYPISIKLGDGKVIVSTHEGPVPLGNEIIQALYVADFRVSLLSVSQLDRSGLRTAFQNRTCTVSRGPESDPEILFTGEIKNGIYVLDTTTAGTAAAAAAHISHNNSSNNGQLWHRRLGHINYDYLKALLPSISQPKELCDTCILAKHTRAAHRKTPATRATRPFELLHSDSCAILAPSFSGAMHYLLFIDDYTRWTFVCFLIHKTAENCTRAFKGILALIRTQYPKFCRIQRFRSDNGTGEYDNPTFREVLADNGIIFEPSPPYTQNMNGVSERMIQSLNTRARSMMIDADIPTQLWAEMINTASYLQKRSPSAALNGRTPYEVLHRALVDNSVAHDSTFHPPLDHLRRIGCVAYHRIPDDKFPNKAALKFTQRSKRCMMIGYSESTKIWKLWEPSKQGGRAFLSTDVIFVEAENAMAKPSDGEKNVPPFPLPDTMETDESGNNHESESVSQPDGMDIDDKLSERENDVQLEDTSRIEGGDVRFRDTSMISEKGDVHLEDTSRIEGGDVRFRDTSMISEKGAVQLEDTSEFRRNAADQQFSGVRVENRDHQNVCLNKSEIIAKRKSKKATRRDAIERNKRLLQRVHEELQREKVTDQAEVELAYNAQEIECGVEVYPTDPLTFQEALSSPLRNEWIQAMRDELRSLYTNHTWEVVADGRQKHTIGSKWVFRTKTNPDNSIRYKARLVIKGYSQVKDIDYKETYAPVSRLASLRVLLAFASENDWACDHMDVKTAFLNPKIDKDDVLMKLPELHGLGDISMFGIDLKGSQIVHLRKALYGLKQAPRLWFKEINTFLCSLGFVPSSVEPSLYLMASVIILLYVDDLLIFYKSRPDVAAVKEKLQNRYRMTDLGPLRRFLGLNIETNPTGYSLHQASYIENMLRRYSMEDAYEVATPIDPRISLELEHDDLDTSVDPKQYLAMVGSLMYAALGGRPDISYAVGLLSRFNADPRSRHLTAARRVLRYLKKTKDLKLIYRKGSGECLHGFVDASWANSKNRKSIGGYTFMLAGAAVSWGSKGQSLVALSTEEAEYTAFTEASREALWFRQLLQDINNRPGTDLSPETVLPTTILADNQAAIKHAKDEGISARTKHFDIRLQHTRDLQQQGIIDLRYIKSAENTADVLTKGLPIDAHQRHVKGLGLG